MNLIDNQKYLLGDDLKRTIRPNSNLKIAASCFSIYAFEALKAELEKINALNFIFTSPTFINFDATNQQKERREFFIPKLNRELSLYGGEFEVRLRNKLTQKSIAKECAKWIQDKAIFKSNTNSATMSGFACIESEEIKVVYTPVSEFTTVELGYQQSNTLATLINKIDEHGNVKKHLQAFDQIWNDAKRLQDVTTLLLEHITSIYQENSPEYIYILILYNLFQEFLNDINEDVLPNYQTGYENTLVWKKLFNFQKDAAIAIINKLETYNGCILADSVGLGKTFTALAVIKYYELRNRSVLVLCPKKLSDNWQNFRHNFKTNLFYGDRFNYTVLCHTDLTRKSGESLGMNLSQINWSNFDLVVIDESHNFRHNNIAKDHETRYQCLLNKVIKPGVKTKVLMLSATPVNNRFSDLRNQLALAYEGNSIELGKKIHMEKSVDEIFRSTQTSFNAWSKLPPQERTTQAILDSLPFDFFKLLDCVTIARSRKHIQTFYQTEDIGQFPNRLRPISHHCQLTNKIADNIEFDAIFEKLSSLKLAVYAPIAYIQPDKLDFYESQYDTQIGNRKLFKQKDREQNLQILITINLLKRLESSVEAFRLTLKSLKKQYENMLNKIEAFRNEKDEKTAIWDVEGFSEYIKELDEDEVVLDNDFETTGKINIKLCHMNLASWKCTLQDDLAKLDELFAIFDAITPEDDAKLQHLKQQILEKIANPINPYNKKILLFTAFADTADYLYRNLAEDLLDAQKIHSAKITGRHKESTIKKSYGFQELLTLFSPNSKDKHLVLPDEKMEIDLLIGTDCISEGQNLQDCDFVVNYDIHWNPVRIIQRFGRIDRIGSKNNSIQLVSYWPDISLDEYINLKERVENRMVIANLSATGDDNLLNGQEENDIGYRKEQLRRLKDEVIELEDLKTGVSITDLGLNDFRIDLINYTKDHKELNRSPRGMHAVIPANSAIGLEPGAIFVLKSLNEHINVHQQNRLYPYYLIYVSNREQIVCPHIEVKHLLDLICKACKGQSNPIQNAYKLFNNITNDGQDMIIYSRLLEAGIRSIIDLTEEEAIDSLFSQNKVTASATKIKGLNDFELMAFLVVQNN